jgi:hypothetical protein
LFEINNLNIKICNLLSAHFAFYKTLKLLFLNKLYIILAMFKKTFKNIDDILWKDSGCSTELDYAEQSSWILFLKWLDDYEKEPERFFY